MRDAIFDETMMREAIALARNGAGRVSPNPLVGAILARDGKPIGRGWHDRVGGPHAEVNAIADARARGESDLAGTTLYVTLEPCCHSGRTGPCVDLIIASGITEVIAGMTDPDPRVRGKGFAALEAAGISVSRDVLGAECRDLNRPFIKRATTGRPFVLLKMATTLDGSATAYPPRPARAKSPSDGNASSRWISSHESRKEVHALRAELAAVMCGIGTALADDPALDVRMTEGRNPIRIIVDSSFRLPATSRLALTAKERRTIVAGIATKNPDALARKLALERAGAETIETSAREGRVNLTELTERLAAMGIDGILLEGGMTLARAFLAEGLVDRVAWYVAPMISGLGALSRATVRTAGPDAVIEGDLNCSPE